MLEYFDFEFARNRHFERFLERNSLQKQVYFAYKRRIQLRLHRHRTQFERRSYTQSSRILFQGSAWTGESAATGESPEGKIEGQSSQEIQRKRLNIRNSEEYGSFILCIEIYTICPRILWFQANNVFYGSLFFSYAKSPTLFDYIYATFTHIFYIVLAKSTIKEIFDTLADKWLDLWTRKWKYSTFD